MKATELMVDLETLGTSPGSCILSIGLCAFNYTDGIVDVVEIVVDDPKGRIDRATVEWWLKQDELAQNVITDVFRVPIKEGLEQFAQFVTTHGCEKFWSNGPTFDEMLLRATWAREKPGVRFPTHFAKSRCCRTAFEVMRKLGIERPQTPSEYNIAHRADHDAARQALSVIELYKTFPN